MLKLYRKNDEGTEYWEAWSRGNEVTIHWGKLGERGEVREVPSGSSTHPDDIIEREAKLLRAVGFKPLKRSEQRCVVIQYKIDRNGSEADLDRRIEIEGLMNESLGWTGLGHCDGGDMGSGEMNVFCYVADTKMAEDVIVRDLRSKGLLNGAVIAERKRDDYTVLWPPDFRGKFSVL